MEVTGSKINVLPTYFWVFSQIYLLLGKLPFKAKEFYLPLA